MDTSQAAPPFKQEAALGDWLARAPEAHLGSDLIARFSRRQLSGALQRGTAMRVAPGIYASAIHAESAFTRVDAAVKWAGEPAWIGGAAALFLVGALRDPPARIEVVVPRERRLCGRPTWVRVRRLSYEPPTMIADRWCAVEPAIAWCLGGAELLPDQRASALCSLTKADPAALERVEWALRSLPVISRRRSLAALCATVATGAESYLEVHAFDQVFVGPGFEGLLRQHAVRTATQRYRLDLYDPASMTALEIDGATYHSGIRQWQHAIRRDLDLASLGILTVRFSYRDLTGRPEWCREKARQVLRVRQSSLRAGPIKPP